MAKLTAEQIKKAEEFGSHGALASDGSTLEDLRKAKPPQLRADHKPKP